MSKTWLIAQHQFRQEASKRSFLLVLFSLPLFLAFTIGMGYLAVRLEEESTTLGYVDRAGLLADTLAEPEEDQVRLVPFETTETARVALEGEEIDAYYVLSADYADTHQAELVYFEPPERRAMRYFENVVRLNLMAGQSPAVVQRALSGANVTVRATESKRDFPGGGPGAGRFVPLIAAAIFAFLVLTTSGYMMGVVVAEKENRTMEIIVSSVSPTQMMSGKIIGALSIALMQLVVWVAFLAGAAWLGGNVLDIGWLHEIDLPWRDIGMIVMVALPSYLFVAALMTMVGSTLVESQEAQQAGAFLFFPVFLPLYLVVPIIHNPNGPLSLVLSFFPVTSVMTMGFRSIFVEVPLWQLGVSAAIALVSGIVMVWLDVRNGWTGQISLAIQIVALVIAALGYALVTWAMASNAFFIKTVRIQDERGQTVATGGPYQYVRHPGYVGEIAFELTTPIMLGSLRALIPGGLTALLFVVRTALEDKTLQEELDGYKEYMERVRYRLLPGLW